MSGGEIPVWVIGKAEELKILLQDWLKDKTGSDGYYSRSRWNVRDKAI